MALSPEFRERLLERSRALWERREFPALVAALSVVERRALLAEPALGFFLADAYHRVGERDRSLALTRALAPACIRRGNDRLARERLNLEGVLLFGMGDLGGAEAAWTALLEASMRADDETMVARAGHNFGVLHTLRGEWDRALVSHERATAAYQRLGHLRGLAQVHNNLGTTYREMDFFPESDRHFLQALEYAQISESQDEAGRARIERALLLCYDGDLALARLTAQRALEAWERMGDTLHTGEAHRVLAVIALSGGLWTEAGEHAEQALELAERAHAALLGAEVREVLAAVRFRQGDRAEAEALRTGAEQGFAAMGARSWGANLRQRLATLPGSS